MISCKGSFDVTGLSGGGLAAFFDVVHSVNTRPVVFATRGQDQGEKGTLDTGREWRVMGVEVFKAMFQFCVGWISQS